MLFLFGVAIGIFFVYAVLFRNRELPAWTPNGRVLQALRSAPIKLDNRTRCILDCHNVNEDDVLLIIHDGKVLFRESNIRNKDIPEYVVRGKGTDGKVLKIQFRSVPNYTEIINVIDGRNSNPQCDC